MALDGGGKKGGRAHSIKGKLLERERCEKKRECAHHPCEAAEAAANPVARCPWAGSLAADQPKKGNDLPHCVRAYDSDLTPPFDLSLLPFPLSQLSGGRP
jgi:hypothetical protein